MEYDVIELPIVGELSDETTPEDLERARRNAAYWHIKQALSLWPWYQDLLIWMQVVSLAEGLLDEEGVA